MPLYDDKILFNQIALAASKHLMSRPAHNYGGHGGLPHGVNEGYMLHYMNLMRHQLATADHTPCHLGGMGGMRSFYRRQGLGMEDPLAKRIKKDALWKPLLRSFRAFFRRLLSPQLEISKVFDVRGDIKPEVRDWCKKFLTRVGAPQEVIESKHYQYALVIIQAPSSASNLKMFFEGAPDVLKFVDDLKPLFCTVFRENSMKLRRRFFTDPLLKHMWARFRDEEALFIKNYIKSLRT